jgi:protein-L-isoaspartate(D-aspartate) O-methyltransferase
MKTLLLLVLSMVAAAREATAQEDAQCVRERAAMVETIRAYARSDASALGQQGLSERVLEAMGQTKRHLFIPSDLAPSHTRTGRFRSASARPYRSRSSWP